MLPDNRLTDKQEMFAQYYVQGMSPLEAALKAGYNANSAGEQGSQNLNKLKIKNRIEELKKPIVKSLEITRERIARNILKIAEPDPNDDTPTRKGDIIKANELLIKLFGIAEPEEKNINITGVQVVTKDQEMSSLINSLKLNK